MDELRYILEDNLNSEFLFAVLSNPRELEAPSKVRVRPVLRKDRLVYQFEAFRGAQVSPESGKGRGRRKDHGIYADFPANAVGDSGMYGVRSGEQEGKDNDQDKAPGGQKGAGQSGA